MSLRARFLGPVLRAAFTAWSRRRLARHSGVITAPGLSADVEVMRDRYGVPHVYAQSDRDAHFAQGYVHAQDRLFQMDVRRRVASGMLSEVFGPQALATDRLARTLGLGRCGAADWTAASPDVRTAFQAYADGVNAWIRSRRFRLPVEFSLLGYRPAEWCPEDSMALARLITWQLAFGWHGELVRSRLRELVGPEAAAEWDGVTSSSNNGVDGMPEIPAGYMSREFADMPDVGALDQQSGAGGSNAWVVSGARSATGSPLLCNDPHLFISSPSVWYEIHLSAPELEVAGASLPGLPAVLIGHNRRIAWGLTAAFTDCQDLFAERFDAGSPGMYRFGDEKLQAEIIDESIRVKGRQDAVSHRVSITRHGPVVAEGPPGSGIRFALSAAALMGPGDASGWLALNKAASWEEFTGALRLVQSVQLHVVYADVDGNIGSRVVGLVPLRVSGDGTLPSPGWTGKHEWSGWVPFEEMPHSFNPPDGVVVTANNRPADAGSRYHLGDAWMGSHRADRVAAVIKGRSKLSIEDCRRLHTDVTSHPAIEFVRRATEFRSDDPDVRTAQQILRDWDGAMTADSAAASVYTVARHRLITNILAPVPDREVAAGLIGVGPNRILAPGTELYARELDRVFRMLDNPDSWWVRAAGGRQAVLERSLKEALHWLRTELGASPSRWGWGRIHRVRFSHPAGLRKPLDAVFDRGPYPIGGDMDTPAQTGIAPNLPFDARAACPSYRQIVDLGRLDESVSIHAPGQSGQLGSRHYDDMVRPWLRGDYHPMLWGRQQVESNAASRMRLVAADGGATATGRGEGSPS